MLLSLGEEGSRASIGFRPREEASLRQSLIDRMNRKKDGGWRDGNLSPGAETLVWEFGFRISQELASRETDNLRLL